MKILVTGGMGFIGSNFIRYMLKTHDDMEIVNGRYSDYMIISEEEWSVIKGVDKKGWVMRSHPRMGEKNKEKEKEYLYLKGN